MTYEDADFYQTLTDKIEKFKFKVAHEFTFKCDANATHEDAEMRAWKEVIEIRRELAKPEEKQWYVDVFTGKRIFCTETELMSRNA